MYNIVLYFKHDISRYFMNSNNLYSMKKNLNNVNLEYSNNQKYVKEEDDSMTAMCI